MDSVEYADLYDAHYYATGCGEVYERNEKWLRFFGGIAQRIIEEINPGTVFDAGCAMGFLVEGFRRRDVEAYGIDISEYAIANVHQDIKLYCELASVTDPFPKKYDLIVSIEVLEHLPKPDAEKAIANLCQYTDDILFSSTPFDYKEITHFNVQPPEYWAEQFARYNFYRDVDFDASFITPWAVRFRRRSEPQHRLIREYERSYWLVAKENLDLRQLSGELRFAEQALQLQVQSMSTQQERLQKRWKDLEQSVGWSLLQKMQQFRAALFPPGSRRDESLEKFFNALRQLKFTNLTAFILRHAKNLAPSGILPAPSLPGGVSVAEYKKWIARNEPTGAELARQKIDDQTMTHQSLISFITPVYNIAPEILRETIESVRAQTCERWELCLANGSSDRADLKALLNEYSQQDARIKVKHLEENLGISGNSNEAIKMATGDFIAILDHDDLIAPNMLFEVAGVLNEKPDTDIIYFDEDKLTADGKTRIEPFFKPEWSPHLLLATNFLMHSIFRRELALQVGAFSAEMDGAQDWDLAFRCVEKTNKIAHIPKILYHWRKVEGSAAGDANAKPWATDAQLRSVSNHLTRQGVRGAQVSQSQFGIIRVQWPHNQPKVSIIIPTKNNAKLLLACLSSIFDKTTYQNYEIILIDNNSTEAAALHYLGLLKRDSRVKIIEYSGQFNYSEANNLGVQQADGDVFVFLNNDTEILDGSWLDDLVGWAVQPHVGVVGAKLIRPDGTIQHAGMVMGLAGHGSHVFDGAPENRHGIFGMAEWYRDYQAVTGACMTVRREVFEALGGFDENYRIGYGDIELCLRAVSANYHVIYTPFARLLHHEGGSRGFFIPPSDVLRASVQMLPWVAANDPYFNLNLSYIKRIPALTQPDEMSKEARIIHIMKQFKLVETDETETLTVLSQKVAGQLTPMSSFGSGEDTPSEARLKIMFVSHDLSLSGAPLVFWLLARYLKSKGYQITLFSPKDGPLRSKYDEIGVDVKIDPAILDYDKLRGDAIAVAQAMQDYEIVVANTILTWTTIHVARALQKPSVWWIHESGRGKDLVASRPEIATAFAAVDAIIFPAQVTASLYTNLIQKDNSFVMPHGLDLDLIKNSIGEAIEKPDKFSVVHVGSIEPRKGQDVLLQAIEDLPPHIQKNLACYFVGRVLDTGFYAKIQKMAQNLNNIHFVGQVPHEQVLAYVQMADLFTLTSRDEVLPITILEAMALGKAILATNVGGIAEVIEHKQNGLLVSSGDYRALASNLARVFDQRAHLSRLGDAARQTFDENLTIDRFGQNITRVIEELDMKH